VLNLSWHLIAWSWFKSKKWPMEESQISCIMKEVISINKYIFEFVSSLFVSNPLNYSLFQVSYERGSKCPSCQHSWRCSYPICVQSNFNDFNMELILLRTMWRYSSSLQNTSFPRGEEFFCST
jgi:hypothetical protein